MAKIFTVLFLLLFSVGAYAQTTTVKGKVVFSDDDGPAIGVVVVVNIADSTKLNQKGRVAATDASGNFTVWANEKNMELTFTYLGYKDRTVKVKMGDRNINLGTVKMRPDSKMIESVSVMGQASMSMIKEDTIQFNAAAFQTHPDATAEDLLKKMPGITTDDDGNVESQGEAIQKVYVNGKEYFEDDPSLALKSLPSNAVESIQLYDDQSDDAKFSGFDDGERIKAINIVVKQGFMNSTSGRASVGYGTDDRYMAGVQLNKYGDVHNYAIIAQANNANKRDFSPMSILSSGGRGGGRGNWSSDNSDLNDYTTTSNGGLNETYMIGGTYSGDFEKVDVSATYFYTGSNALNLKTTEQSYLTTAREYYQADSSMGWENSHRLSSKIKWDPTDYDRFNITLSASYSNNYGGSSMYSQTILDSLMNNWNDSEYNTRLDRFSGSMGLWWQHRFEKPGRTLSLGGTFSGNIDDGTRDQYSLYSSLDDLSAAVLDTIDQIGVVASSGYNVKGSITYSEPIGERSRVRLNYSATYDRSFSDNDGLNYDAALQTYSLEDTTTTNNINRNYTTHLVGLGYNYALGKQFTLNATLNYQYSTLNNTQITPIYDNVSVFDQYSFDALLPSLTVNYMPAVGQNIKFDYNAYSSFPSVSQLQEVLNTTNPLQVSQGNPDLEQSYTHKIRLGYNLAIPEKNLNLNIFAQGTLTSNYIATHRQYLTADTTVNGTTIVSGAQFSKPVNLQGYESYMVNTTFSVGIKPLKSNLSLNAYYRYTKTPSIEDDVEYMSFSNRFGGGVSLTSNISENVDFTLAYRPGVSFTTSSAGSMDEYYSHNLEAFLNVIFLKYFFISTDASWKNSFGTQSSYTQHYAIVNAAIGAKFLSNRQAEIRIGVYDALDQNQSLWQTAADTYTQITSSQVLGRYYMATLSFKFDTRSKRDRGSSDDDGGERRGPGGYGGGPGGGGSPRM
ncbi:MAG: outer membrane beta-barrel protein [Rikenellaceae bacterium]